MTKQKHGHSLLQARRAWSLNLKALGEGTSKSGSPTEVHITPGGDSVQSSNRKVIKMVSQKQYEIERLRSSDVQVETRMMEEGRCEENDKLERKKVFEL